MKHIVVISDLQMPLEHNKANKNLIRFIGEYQPDEVINIGDITDYTAPARWSAGKRAEYGMTVKQEAAYTIKNHLEPVRAVYDGRYTLLGSNHGERPHKYLVERCPAMFDEDAFQEQNLLCLDDLGMDFEPLKYDFAPGWIATHGHARGISLARYAGGTAINAAKKFGKSVVMGHTHRAAITNESSGEFASKKLTGVEVGHLMDVKKAGYLGGAGLSNWQMAFGLLYVDGSNVTPHIIPVNGNGSFVVEGQRY
ncbi:hypothetical protein MOV08_05120 [Streptomyces yunnanensis]|uniref:Calcineurin-like phosphoesterase superfamily domain-containing protein n=1 Tax=Streptomyces yunnanensis TaxID=156453 RepID=A0ABY8A1H5_9ACTN|nr:hypothetical protein [Streptomyces yunnanensis]WEB38743.1 hypothetical protein MOV08_05120 [Streptomyces yunnanensis]